jgi:hypothetical protein
MEETLSVISLIVYGTMFWISTFYVFYVLIFGDRKENNNNE